MRLIGDIGGTNVRFALTDCDGNIGIVKKYLKTEFKNITEAIIAYKSSIKEEITEAVLAVNTPVVKGVPDINALINYWGYNSETIKQDTQISKITYINDLTAHAMAIPYLKDTEYEKLYGGNRDNEGPIVVIGPGTGLGTAYGLFNQEHKKYDFHPSEGGGQIVSAVDKKQINIVLKVLEKKPFMVCEMVSGRGITLIYNALYEEKKSTEEIMKELHEGSEKSKEVFDIFCEFLGILTRNLATTFLSTGGIYIIGGILGREENLELFKKSKFIDYYNFTTGYETNHIKDYPIYIIKHPNPALVGLANY